MTCNPDWPEIKENLFPGQRVSDRPDLVARIFDLKKDAMVDYVVKGDHGIPIFGRVRSYVYVIEWQKRGLPHCHMLVTLEKEYKMMTAEQVDKFILVNL